MNSTVTRKIFKTSLASLFLMGGVAAGSAEVPVEYNLSVTAQASSKSLAPYMLGSWNEGRYVDGRGIWQEASAEKPLDLSHRFSWSAGIGYLAGVGSKTDYMRWEPSSESWGRHEAARSDFRITRLYGEVKYRGACLYIGMKGNHSRIVDDGLSSGDLVRSVNATPVSGVSIGFVDFQDIPFTRGWVQIDGEIMYGKMMDSGFKRDEFNYYDDVLSQNLWYNYKRCYFRTNPDKNFSVTIGMQAAGLFAGSAYSYRNGKLQSQVDRGFKLKTAFQMFLPMPGGEEYYTGSHLGSWDFKADYRLPDGSRLSAYFQWPWEDGSGIGRMNGWDGLWGLQYEFPRNAVVSKAVIEYLDFTNQSGPIHFDPDDNADSPLSGHAQGADNYYNNDYYGAYSYYGMSIGTPFLLAPVYNRNGSLDFLHTRARGFHIGVEGHPSDRFSYQLKAGYEVAGGSGWIPDYKKSHSTSAMLGADYKPIGKLPQLSVGLRLAFDKGSLRGDNFGARLQVAYQGIFDIKKSSR